MCTKPRYTTTIRVSLREALGGPQQKFLMELPLVLPLELLVVLPPWISMVLPLVLLPPVTSLGAVLPHPGVPCAQFIFYKPRPAHLTSSTMAKRSHPDSDEDIHTNPDGSMFRVRHEEHEHLEWANTTWWEDQTCIQCNNCGSWSPFIWLIPCSVGFTRPGACDIVLCSNCADRNKCPRTWAVYCDAHYPVKSKEEQA